MVTTGYLRVLRSPGRYRQYGGTVTAVRVLRRRALYWVDYDDHDYEEMSEDELLRWLSPFPPRGGDIDHASPPPVVPPGPPGPPVVPPGPTTLRALPVTRATISLMRAANPPATHTTAQRTTKATPVMPPMMTTPVMLLARSTMERPQRSADVRITASEKLRSWAYAAFQRAPPIAFFLDCSGAYSAYFDTPQRFFFEPIYVLFFLITRLSAHIDKLSRSYNVYLIRHNITLYYNHNHKYHLQQTTYKFLVPGVMCILYVVCCR